MKKIKLLNIIILTLIMLSALTGCGGGGGTDEINIVQPTETAAQKSMSTMNDIAKFLRLEVAQKAEAQALISSALTSSNQYVPAAGDILNFGFHNNDYNFTSQYTLDIENSTNDALVYKHVITNDDIGKTNNATMTITKTTDGIMMTEDLGDNHNKFEYVLRNNEVDEYSYDASGNKVFEARITPGASTDSFEVTAADGSLIQVYTNASVVKK